MSGYFKMQKETFSLRWKDCKTHLSSSISDVFTENSFSDVQWKFCGRFFSLGDEAKESFQKDVLDMSLTGNRLNRVKWVAYGGLYMISKDAFQVF